MNSKHIDSQTHTHTHSGQKRSARVMKCATDICTHNSQNKMANEFVVCWFSLGRICVWVHSCAKILNVKDQRTNGRTIMWKEMDRWCLFSTTAPHDGRASKLNRAKSGNLNYLTEINSINSKRNTTSPQKYFLVIHQFRLLSSAP